MNAAVGQSAVLLGLLASVLGVATYAVALVRGRPRLLKAARTYTWLVLAGAVLAAAAMERALLTNDFSLKFVASNDSRSTPTLFKVTAMWSALEGSILLWTLILAGYLVVMAVRFRDRSTDPMVGWAGLTGLVVSAFFFGLMVGPANPFRQLSGVIPTDGPGPNPLLQNHPLVAFHPPMLYLGFVGFTIPVWVRRLVTMIPTVVIVYIGLNPTQSLFWSQVVLSLVLPIPIIALIPVSYTHLTLPTICSV